MYNRYRAIRSKHNLRTSVTALMLPPPLWLLPPHLQTPPAAPVRSRLRALRASRSPLSRAAAILASETSAPPGLRSVVLLPSSPPPPPRPKGRSGVSGSSAQYSLAPAFRRSGLSGSSARHSFAPTFQRYELSGSRAPTQLPGSSGVPAYARAPVSAFRLSLRSSD